MKSFYEAIGMPDLNKTEKRRVSEMLNISTERLDYFNNNHILPDIGILERIEQCLGISKNELMLKMGIYDTELKKYISDNFSFSLQDKEKVYPANDSFQPVFETDLGKLFQGDCLKFLSTIENESFDLIFADPPFNLDKLYPSKIDDNLKQLEYIEWCEHWIDECIRTLRVGGSLFIWNLPKWNTFLSKYLNDRLTFRNWISVDIKYSLPISGRLYPSHYSLLYYVKGERPTVFKPDRMPMEICGKCYNEIKDYGGYKKKMNPLGINLTDVWYDIPPVRHSKYKARKDSNELPVKLLDRIIEMASNVGDIIFDPFGGAGTTYVTAEIKRRKWIGIEIGPVEDIINRFNNIDIDKDLVLKYRKSYNHLFLPHIEAKRKEKGLWICDCE